MTTATDPLDSPGLAGLEQLPASEVVARAVERFGDGLTLLCSGQDAVLVDVALRVDPTIEVAFLDTGFHFPETIETMLAIAERYRPRLRVIAPWRHLPGVGRPGFCCSEHKVEQLDLALEGRTAWLSGLRRADSADRADTPVVGRDRRGLVKLNPLATWSDDDVARYIADHDVIVNPLQARGYPSIGCRPCTRPAEPGADARSGRWADSERTECGIHR